MSILQKNGSLHRLYRATYTQAIIIGLLSFTQPGVWSAIAGLGAGGLSTTTTSNTASSILFGIMFFLSPVFAVLINKIGIKPVVIIGTLGYVVWSAGLYQNSKDGTQWLIMFGAATCGVSASAFWTSEAAVATLYPTDLQRGLFVGTWQVINKIGNLVAGAVTLALNYNNSASGSVSLNTYIGLIVIQCAGFPLSFLLSPPEKLIRNDGRRLKSNITNETWKQRVINLFKVLKKKELLCLVPLMISNTWSGTWSSNYATHRFSVRVRALNTLLSAVICGATDIIAGYYLDLKIKKSTKVKSSWYFIAVTFTAYFIWAFILQAQFDNNPESGIDWTGNSRYAKAFVPLQIFKIPTEVAFNWLYWVIGAYQFEASEVPYITGWIRTFESLGQCLAFVIGTVNDSDMTNLAVSAAVFFASIPSVTYLVWQVDDNVNNKFVESSDEEFATDGEDTQSVSNEKTQEAVSVKDV